MSSSPPLADQASPAAASPSGPNRGRLAWIAALLVVAALLVARNLSGLQDVPAGAYVDETSIGYNAWAISTAGVDEHGAHLPLYFTAFGEYKNPVYIYTLSALLEVLPLTVTTERLPAALFGLLTCLFITLLAWQRTRSRAVTLVVLLLTALTPWLTIESRVGFEVVSMLALVAAALWCLSVATSRRSAWWYLAAGCCLGIAVFAYSTGRLAVLLIAMVLVVAELWQRRRPGVWLWALPPIAAAYGGLLAWNTVHPGALAARFNLISIAADGAPLATVAGRFVRNYLTYFGPDFLVLQGDQVLRHSTHLGGVVLWAMIPMLIVGLAAALSVRSNVYGRLLVGALLVAPVSAALTNEDVPHALRASVMLPVLLAIAIEGLAVIERRMRWQRAALLVLIAAITAQGVLFTVDMYVAWPARSAAAFDAGEIDAITRAAVIAGRAPVLLSSTLDPPYISAAFALRPAPPPRFTQDSLTPLLAAMHMEYVDPAEMPTMPGAIAVLDSTDTAPANAERLFDERIVAAPFSFGPSASPAVTVVVYRLH